MEILFKKKKSMIEKYCFIPGGSLYRRFTYAFIHKDFLHLIPNAICFLLFWSPYRLMIFFISIPFCTLFSKNYIIGASGPVMAMIAYACLENGYWYFLLPYMAYSALASAKYWRISNIHHLSHFMGAVCAIFLFIFVSWMQNQP